MAERPILPGFEIHEKCDKKYHLKQNFKMVNGFNFPKTNLITNPEYKWKNSVDKTQFHLYPEFPEFPSNNNSKTTIEPFIPDFVKHDRQCLSFQGYWKQASDYTQPSKHICRKINVIYYLEDDTLTIIEPPIPNSSYTQGRLVRRGRIPSGQNNNKILHWTHLNTKIDLQIYGIVYHLCSCDSFTREYLKSQGIEVNENEEIPMTNFHTFSDINQNIGIFNFIRGGQASSDSDQDKLSKFLQYDKKVLRFFAVCYENEDDLHEVKYYKIYYYLIDDTIEIRECDENSSADNPFKRLFRRNKLPKDPKGLYNDDLVAASSQRNEFYHLHDLMVGASIYVLRKKFRIHDCDQFTRNYYKECLKIEQPAQVILSKKEPKTIVKLIPPHVGIGQPEDTLQSCLSIIPKPPRKDVIHYVENTNKFLRYSAKLKTHIESDQDREFILQYSLADGKISIYENGKPNSGFKSGYFLKPIMVPKKYVAQEEENIPKYYSPKEFKIGNNVNIFGREFTITGADLAVYQYIQNEPWKFGEDVRNNIEEYLNRMGILPINNPDKEQNE